MVRPRKPEEPDRYPPCVRCAGCYPSGARWPDGLVCQYCYRAAHNRRGRCATCDHEGVLPGVDQRGRATCRSCSGIRINVDCLRCGTEDTLYRAGTCVRCALRDDLRGLLAGTDGQVDPRFDPFIELVVGMPRPNSGMAWIRVNRLRHGGTVPDLLQRLGTGQLALTHDAFDELPANRTTNHLRGLLAKAGLLPPRDEMLARYSNWLTRKLQAIPDEHQRRIIGQYGRWDHLRRLRQHAQQGPVTLGQVLTAKQYTTVAVDFLAWLGERNRVLAECTQADLDTWFAGGTSTRQIADAFLRWAVHHRLLPKLDLPIHSRQLQVSPFSTGQRLACLQKLLLSDTIPLPHRVAGGLLLLFGLSVGRIVALRLNQINTAVDASGGGTTTIRVAEDSLFVPEPLATLLRTYLGARPNVNTATNHDAPWVFPGNSPGRHLTAAVLADALARHGVPSRAGRTGTWQQLFREGPPQLLARSLGISPATALKHAALAGSDWTAYAADRSRRSPHRT
jgi:hypothetical protein